MRQIFLVFCSRFCFRSAHSNRPATPRRHDGAAKFTSNTQLVVETVIVKDKSGKPIEGLTAKDFTITEDGKPQVIRFCEFQALKNLPEAPPQLLASARQ